MTDTFRLETSEKWNISCHVGKQRMSRSSAIAVTTDSELVSPKRTQERKNTCLLAAVRLQPLPKVSPEFPQDVKTHNIGPTQMRCLSEEGFQ